MDRPNYSATVKIGGNTSVWNTDAFPDDFKTNWKLNTKQSFTLVYTFVKEDGTTQFDLATLSPDAQLLIKPYGSSAIPIVLSTGVVSSSGGGINDILTFEVLKSWGDGSNLATFPVNKKGAMVLYTTIQDATDYFSIFERLNIEDDEFDIEGAVFPSIPFSFGYGPAVDAHWTKIFGSIPTTVEGALDLIADGPYKGGFSDESDLTTAHATAVNGDFALVQATDSLWIWDTDTVAWINGGGDLDLTQVNGWTGQQYAVEQTLTDQATISWNFNTEQIAKVTLAGDRIMDAPTNLKAGAYYTLSVIQDVTGTRLLTWDNLFLWPSGTPPVLSTDPDAIDIIGFYCDGTNLHGLIAQGTTLSYAKYEDQKSSGTAGGSSSSGDQTRTLNTEVSDPDNIATLSANAVTPIAGTYIFRCSAPCHIGDGHNITLKEGSNVVLTGTTEYTSPSGGNQNRSFIEGIVVADGIKSYFINHNISSAQATNGLGAVNSNGTEVYSTLSLTKIG